MKTCPRRVSASVLALVLCAGVAGAGDSVSQSNFGGSFFSSNKPCQARNLPNFEAIAPVPAFIDPFEQDLVPVFCQIRASKKGNGVKNFKADYTSQLVVIDNNTGMAEAFPISSGKFATNSDGVASFDFDLPSELFADGFESGDVSAWSYTRVDPKKKKKTDNVSVQCGGSSSSSSN